MIEEKKCLFSKEQLDNVSNILKNNISVLENNKDYCNQLERITDLQEKLSSSIKDEEVQNLFLEYDSMIIDSVRYELSLIYNVGILTGIELSNMKNEIETNSKQYLSKRIIDFSKYLNQEQIKFLEELKIFIDNRLYTAEEFDQIDREVFAHFNSSIYSQKSINEILEIFAKISSDYEIK